MWNKIIEFLHNIFGDKFELGEDAGMCPACGSELKYFHIDYANVSDGYGMSYCAKLERSYVCGCTMIWPYLGVRWELRNGCKIATDTTISARQAV